MPIRPMNPWERQLPNDVPSRRSRWLGWNGLRWSVWLGVLACGCSSSSSQGNGMTTGDGGTASMRRDDGWRQRVDRGQRFDRRQRRERKRFNQRQRHGQ